MLKSVRKEVMGERVFTMVRAIVNDIRVIQYVLFVVCSSGDHCLIRISFQSIASLGSPVEDAR